MVLDFYNTPMERKDMPKFAQVLFDRYLDEDHGIEEPLSNAFEWRVTPQWNDIWSEAYHCWNFEPLRKRCEENEPELLEEEKKKFKLPKYFAIKWADDSRWKEYIDWLNEKYWSERLGKFDNSYYWYDGSCYDGWVDRQKDLEKFENNPTEITLDQREEAVKGENLRVINADKSQRKHYTYTVKYTRSDGVEFTKEEIDGRKVEDIEQEIKEKRKEAKRLQGLLKSHSNLDF